MKESKTPGQLVIRAARPDDAEALSRVHVRSWQQTYRGQVPDYYLDNLDSDIERRTQNWLGWIAHSDLIVLVAEVDASVVGFALAGPDREDRSRGELLSIYLLSEYWDRGIGYALHQGALEHFRQLGFAEAVLWVLDSNERTRKWYERQGWSSDGAHKKEDARGFVLNELRYRIKL